MVQIALRDLSMGWMSCTSSFEVAELWSTLAAWESCAMKALKFSHRFSCSGSIWYSSGPGLWWLAGWRSADTY